MLALRLLRVILPTWQVESTTKMSLLDKLFHLLGFTALTCPHDSFSPSEGRLARARVPLTASQSSTVAEECVLLLRSLHASAGWDQVLNQFLGAKLSVAGQLLTRGPLLNIQVLNLNSNYLNTVLSVHLPFYPNPVVLLFEQVQRTACGIL